MAVAVPDANLAINLFTLAVLGIFAVPVLNSKRKDGIISEQEKVIEAHAARINQLRDSDTRAAACEAKYAELKQYAAPDAFKLMADQMISLERAVTTAVQGNGELVLQSTALLSENGKALEAAISQISEQGARMDRLLVELAQRRTGDH